MKKFLLFIILFFVSGIASSQSWQWASQAGGVNEDGAAIIAQDLNNNIYIGGRFKSLQCWFENDTLGVMGDNDALIAKFDDNGNEIWSKRIGGNNPFHPTGSVVEGLSALVYDSASNSLYIAGSLYGAGSIDTFSLPGGLVAFIAKCDLNGVVSWVKTIDGNGGKVGLDSIGNIYMTGSNEFTATVGSNSINPGGFLAKFDNNGNNLWIKKILGYNNSSVHVDAVFLNLEILNNELYREGVTYNDTIVIDTTTIIANTANYGGQLILSKFDLNGNMLDVNLDGGPNMYFVFADMEQNGNTYITGAFEDSARFDTISFIAVNNSSNAYVAKYDNSGNLVWVSQIASSVESLGFGICYFNGFIYVTGSFRGTTQFGAYSIAAQSSNDMFIAIYDTNGNCVGVRNFGRAFGYGIASDANGNCIVTGAFDQTVSIGSTNLTTYGYEDILLAKHDIFTGVNEIEENHSLKQQLIIYSNPNNGSFKVKLPEEIKSSRNAKLYIYDNVGKLISSFSLDKNPDDMRFDISHSPIGFYFVKLIQDEKTYSGKLIIE